MPEPILIDCPGVGDGANLADGFYGNCQFCNARLPVDKGRMTPHMTHDVLGMLNRGDFDG